MPDKSSSVFPAFSSRLGFILAAIGAAVGLGNVWRFPYEAGENGGGAFVLIYLIGMVLVAAPIFLCEALIGRRGRGSPPTALLRQAVEHGRSRAWRIPGLLGVIGALVLMSFYSVIAGWSLHYMLGAGAGHFTGLDADAAQSYFARLQGSPQLLLLWQGTFIMATMAIVGLGVNRGIERGMRLMMPLLALLLIGLVVYAFVAGEGRMALHYLFAPDFSAITPEVALAAVGQSLFSVSVGLGGIMMYAAYLPRGASLPGSAAYVISADTAVALLAGLAIFPIVFAHGLAPDSGPGLIFITLPLAFGEMPFGNLVGFAFCFFLFVAALTSSVALYEPMTAYLGERGVSRRLGVAVAASLSWVMGIFSVLSFNLLSDMVITPFQAITWGLNNLVLPVGALILAYFAGRLLHREATVQELGMGDGRLYRGWRLAVRWIAPGFILLLFVSNLLPESLFS
ncbi:sodium-dependent transporter [Gammaproteobacteria bacterium AB-CW1]|uniref:Transporter n=1 Tax=Natronospira elongata TaxID=3110268 RepID=A0AAP6JGN6_9GAMM|nr:sodium-dependent transporter [Gammaproteobacteria bacterium AB-CW1]